MTRRFRKKPVEIEAEQFTGRQPYPVGVCVDPATLQAYVITAHEQRVDLAPGDWVIPEATAGVVYPDRYYPVKPDVFAATYDAVEDEA